MSSGVETTIRPAASSDVAAIAEILREVEWLPHMKDKSAVETEKQVSRHLEMCRTDNSHTVLVAQTSSGTVAGYVSTHWLPYLMLGGPEGFISELFVRESARGKGIGKQLIEEIKREALERGCSRLHLVTGKHRAAYRIYQKLGWKERAEISDFVLPLA